MSYTMVTGIKTKEIKSSYDELTASDSSKKVGHKQQLEAQEGSIVSKKEREGM